MAPIFFFELLVLSSRVIIQLLGLRTPLHPEKLLRTPKGVCLHRLYKTLFGALQVAQW